MNKWAVYNLLALTVYFPLAFLLVGQWAVDLDKKNLFLGVFACWLILVVGIQIMHVQFKEGQFVNRFILTTTFQMLGFMSLSAFFIFSKVDQPKVLLLSLAAAHVGGLIIQTLFFLRVGKTRH